MDNILSIGEMQVPITRIADLRELPGMEWITALRAPAVAALARDGGPLHMPALLGWANSRNLVLGALDARSTSLEEAFHAVASSSGHLSNVNDNAEDVAA